MNGYRKVTKQVWYAAGGLSNPRCLRVARGAGWEYFYNEE